MHNEPKFILVINVFVTHDHKILFLKYCKEYTSFLIITVGTALFLVITVSSVIFVLAVAAKFHMRSCPDC